MCARPVRPAPIILTPDVVEVIDHRSDGHGLLGDASWLARVNERPQTEAEAEYPPRPLIDVVVVVHFVAPQLRVRSQPADPTACALAVPLVASGERKNREAGRPR